MSDDSTTAGASVRVSELITAAQRHLERFGDTPVGVVIHGPGAAILHVEDVVRTGYDQYEMGGDVVFEVEATSVACLDPAEEVIRRLRTEVAELKAGGVRCPLRRVRGRCARRRGRAWLGRGHDPRNGRGVRRVTPDRGTGRPVSAEQLEEVRRRVATVMRLGLVGGCPDGDPAGVDDESRRRWIGRIAEWSDWIHAQYAAVLAEDPPGARHELVARGTGGTAVTRIWGDLTAAQADGRACVACGLDFTTRLVRSHPVGRAVDGAQVFVCVDRCYPTALAQEDEAPDVQS